MRGCVELHFFCDIKRNTFANLESFVSRTTRCEIFKVESGIELKTCRGFSGFDDNYRHTKSSKTLLEGQVEQPAVILAKVSKEK